MGTVVTLHARLKGPHYHCRTLRFGREWKAHCLPEDFLEFSEYGRSPSYPRGSWLAMSIALGTLMWLTLAVVFL
jgi:hypothetical protein